MVQSSDGVMNIGVILIISREILLGSSGCIPHGACRLFSASLLRFGISGVRRCRAGRSRGWSSSGSGCCFEHPQEKGELDEIRA